MDISNKNDSRPNLFFVYTLKFPFLYGIVNVKSYFYNSFWLEKTRVWSMSNTNVFLFYKRGGKKGFVVNFYALSFYIVFSNYYSFTVIENYASLLKQGKRILRHSTVFCHQLFLAFFMNSETYSILYVLYRFVSCYSVTYIILLHIYCFTLDQNLALSRCSFTLTSSHWSYEVALLFSFTISVYSFALLVTYRI